MGTVASRDSTLLQLRTNPRTYEFLGTILDDARAAYGPLRENDYDPPSVVLSYACLFLALDRFSAGNDSRPKLDSQGFGHIPIIGDDDLS